MHDGKNEDVIGFDGVEHTVREYVRQAAADIFVYDPPATRRFENALDRVLDGVNVPLGKRAPMFAVVRGRFEIFGSASG